MLVKLGVTSVSIESLANKLVEHYVKEVSDHGGMLSTIAAACVLVAGEYYQDTSLDLDLVSSTCLVRKEVLINSYKSIKRVCSHLLLSSSDGSGSTPRKSVISKNHSHHSKQHSKPPPRDLKKSAIQRDQTEDEATISLGFTQTFEATILEKVKAQETVFAKKMEITSTLCTPDKALERRELKQSVEAWKLSLKASSSSSKDSSSLNNLMDVSL